MANNEYVEVYRANGQLEADMIRLMLEANGLHVVTRQESAGAVYGLTIGPMGEVPIYVLENEEADAAALLEAMEAGKLEQNLPDETLPSESEEDLDS